jgi:ABC-type lipoprotein release transport system permease subunit
MTQQEFTRTLIEDPETPGEFLLDLGDDLVNQLGWKVGDTITWINNLDGTWTLRKKKQI